MGRERLALQARAASADWYILSLMMTEARSARRCGIPLLQGLCPLCPGTDMHAPFLPI